MVRLAVVVLVGATVACGNGSGKREPDAPEQSPDAAVDAAIDAPPPGDLPLSGTRIKTSWLTTTDDFKFQPSSYDSLMKTSCAWLDTSDGKRCISPVSFGGTYLDAGCTQPVVMISPTSCQPAPVLPPYVTTSLPTTCGSQVVSVNALGAQLTATQIFTGSPGNCFPGTIPTGANLYAIGTPIPLSMFVKAVPAIETGSGRLAHTHLLAEDGARIVTGIQDTQLAVPCQLQGATDLVRCLPDFPFTPTTFSDADCQSPVVAKPFAGPCTPAATTVTLYDPTSCSGHVFQRGPDFNATGLYARSGTSCIAFDQTGVSYQHLGSEIEVPTLHRSPPATRLGLGTVGLDGFTSTYGVIGSLHDNRFDFDCLPFMHGADGVRRCLPAPFPAAQVVYTDAACTTSIRVVPASGPVISSTTCALGQPPFAVERESVSCITPPFLAHVFPVTTRITTPLYAKGTSCDQLPTTSVWYGLGPEEPASSFEEIRSITEP